MGPTSQSQSWILQKIYKYSFCISAIYITHSMRMYNIWQTGTLTGVPFPIKACGAWIVSREGLKSKVGHLHIAFILPDWHICSQILLKERNILLLRELHRCTATGDPYVLDGRHMLAKAIDPTKFKEFWCSVWHLCSYYDIELASLKQSLIESPLDICKKISVNGLFIMITKPGCIFFP